jgi:hypothetical protein
MAAIIVAKVITGIAAKTAATTTKVVVATELGTFQPSNLTHVVI